MEKRDRSASDVLEGVVKDNLNDYISFADIKMSLHERGFGLLMLIFALPLTVPALPPGMTAIPAIPLTFFSIQMIRGVDAPWLPKWVESKRIKRTTLAFMVEKASPFLRKIEKLLRPRLSFASSALGEKIIGVFCLAFSVSILVPLPLTNLMPAVGIALMSLGLLSKDGITIIFGMIVGALGTSITLLILIQGPKAVQKIFSGLFSFF